MSREVAEREHSYILILRTNVPMSTEELERYIRKVLAASKLPHWPEYSDAQREIRVIATRNIPT